MKVFVTGVGGQLGHDCMRELISRGHEAVGSDVMEHCDIGDKLAFAKTMYVSLDITDKDMVNEIVESIAPDAIVHCAAWTDVDGAEVKENRAKVEDVNYRGTQYLAEAAKSVGAKLLYLSTDYVFDGSGDRPWQPEDESNAPLNYYGLTKLEGEQAVCAVLEKCFIVRTAWVFGLKGSNFVKTMIEIGQTHSSVRVVNDQIGTPTYTSDLCRLLVDMIETEKYGIYHATNEGGYISWYDFCCEIYRQCGLNTGIIPVSTTEYGQSRAIRPKNSRLDKSKLSANGFQPLPHWKDAVSRYLKSVKL